MNASSYRIAAIVLVAFFVLSNSWFVVVQTQQAIVFQFRDVVRIVDKPGLHLKVPFLQTVGIFERRVLAVDAPTQEVMLDEQKPILVDAFARYRISDPLKFYQRLRTERVANDRLGSLLNASLRSVFGTIKMTSVLSEERDQIMAKIRDQVNAEVKDMGIEIIDVRIRRADLPANTSAAVFARMNSQRAQEAAQLRATGQQEATQIKADADRQATVILAEAQGAAEKMKGDGDKKALDLLSNSAGKDPKFFAFWRSLTAYRQALKSENTSYVLSPDSEFFKYFGTGK